MTRKRRVLYGRTSVDTSKGKSVDDQLSDLREWAEDDEREIVGEFRDDGISASRFANGRARDGWTAVLALITSGEIDEVGVWESSRTSRKIAESSDLLDVCAANGVHLAVRDRTYDPANPDDRARLLHEAVDAEHESGRLSKRLKRRTKSRVTDGRPHGRLNYGYKIERHPDTGKTIRWVPDPETAPVIREMVARLLAGETAGTIARDLTARGKRTRTGSPWVGANIIATVRRPVYAGLRASRVHAVPDDHAGTWEPLISREDHDRLIALITDPSRKAIRTGSHSRHLLSGIAACGRCGGRIRTITRKASSSGAKVIDYTCKDCSGVSRTAEPTDHYVGEVAVAFLSRPDVAEQLSDPADDARKAARAEAAEHRRKLAEIESQMAGDELDIVVGSRLLKDRRGKLERAETAARPQHVPDAVYDVAGPAAAVRWEATPIGVRREIIRALFTVVIERGKVGGRPGFRPETVTVERRKP